MSASFTRTFITDDRWLQLLRGLGTSLEITLFAALLGIALGFLVAIVRSSYDKTLLGKKCIRFSDYILKFFNGICNIYIVYIFAS